MKLLRGKSGFSLTELLITVGVIGILGGMSAPTYLQYRKKARRAESYQLLSAIRGAQLEHYSTQGTYSPTIQFLTVDDPTASGANTFYTYHVCAGNDSAEKVVGDGTKMGAATTPGLNNTFTITSCTNWNDAANPSFVAFALGQIDNDATLDNILIGEKGKICEPPHCTAPDSSHSTVTTGIPTPLSDDVKN